MRAGKMRCRGVVQQPPTSRSSSTWTTYINAWAEITARSQREYMNGNANQSEITHEIRMRYRSGVTPDMRFSYNGRYFRFVSVVNVDERDRELYIEATERFDDD
jgi:SPP1 family predicted phage head-tail adaptor